MTLVCDHCGAIIETDGDDTLAREEALLRYGPEALPENGGCVVCDSCYEAATAADAGALPPFLRLDTEPEA